MQRDKAKFKELLDSGKTLEEIGVVLGVSRQRVGQLKQKWFGHLDRTEFGCGKRTKEKRDAIRQEYLSKWRKKGRETGRWEDPVAEAKWLYFTRKKQNNKNRGGMGWEWDIEFLDVDWVDVCPVFGVELNWFADKWCDNSPSLDRIDSSKGYVKGNVALISWRANRIKNDATAGELRKIADWMDSTKPPTGN